MDVELSALSLKDIFNQSAAETLRAFPQLKFLYLGTTKETIYISPEAVAQLSAAVIPLQEQLNKRILYMEQMHACGLAFSLLGRTDAIPGVLVADYGGSKPELRVGVSERFPEVVDTIIILDHEIGHQIVPGGRSDPRSHVRECLAEAYSALRHAQRFGNTTDYFSYGPFTRARQIVHDFSPKHYTSAVMLKVGELKDKVDLSALTPRETVALARDIAFACNLPDAALGRITEAFKPLRTYFKECNIDRKESYTISPATHPNYFRIFFDILRAHQDDKDIYKAGSLIIAHHADAIRAQAALGQKPFWQDGLDFMEGHDKSTSNAPSRPRNPPMPPS